MLERVTERARAHAERRARERRTGLAERLRAEALPGVQVEEGADGVRLIGSGLRRRLVLDRAFRWLTARVR